MSDIQASTSGCQVIGFSCLVSDLCTRCKGTGNDPEEELCMNCDHCFDEVLGWSTGIEPRSPRQSIAREYVLRDKGDSNE